MEYAFTRDKRILTSKDYENVFVQAKKQGVKIDMPGFFVLITLNDKDKARIGFALSKKYLPTACLRNRMKRIFRESFRLQWSMLKNIDIIFLAKHGLSSLSNKVIWENLAMFWQKVDNIYPK